MKKGFLDELDVHIQSLQKKSDILTSMQQSAGTTAAQLQSAVDEIGQSIADYQHSANGIKKMVATLSAVRTIEIHTWPAHENQLLSVHVNTLLKPSTHPQGRHDFP